MATNLIKVWCLFVLLGALNWIRYNATNIIAAYSLIKSSIGIVLVLPLSYYLYKSKLINPDSHLIPWAASIFSITFCFVVSYFTSTYFECILSFGINMASFLFYAWPNHSEKYYDFTGSLTFLSCAVFSMITSWTVRLGKSPLPKNPLHSYLHLPIGIFLFLRVANKNHNGVDKRFDELRDNFAKFLIAWCLQATWAYLCSLPLFIVNSIENANVYRLNDQVSNVTVFDLIGWMLWTFGWIIEIVADRQKSKFKDNPKNQGKFCNVGLWKLSRHPNYFGEITLWIGIFISAASIAKGSGWLMILSPIWTIILLVFTSGIPLAEKTAMKKYKNTPGYKQYVQTVPVLIPFSRSDRRKLY